VRLSDVESLVEYTALVIKKYVKPPGKRATHKGLQDDTGRFIHLLIAGLFKIPPK
jgi:hypothetical protein